MKTTTKMLITTAAAVSALCLSVFASADLSIKSNKPDTVISESEESADNSAEKSPQTVYTVSLGENGTITVVNSSTGKKTASYPVIISQFSESDIKLLKKGITVNSDAELSAVIEDYTS